MPLRTARRPARISSAAAVACIAGLAAAGGTPENLLLIIDPTDRESMHVGNYYRHARNVPESNVIYMHPGAAGYAEFVEFNLAALFATIQRRAIEDQVDYIVIMPGAPFYISAPGYVSDGCSPVNRFSISGAYTTAFMADDILAGTLASTTPNGFFTGTNTSLRFDSQIAWKGGNPAGDGTRYFIGAMLGYTGERGNSRVQILSMIDRSVAVDGARPAGTFYFMQTTDELRSGPRHGRASCRHGSATGGACRRRSWSRGSAAGLSRRSSRRRSAVYRTGGPLARASLSSRAPPPARSSGVDGGRGPSHSAGSAPTAPRGECAHAGAG